MNCPICLSIIQNSCTPSCCHHFCYDCLINWINNKGSNCPLCNQNINEIKIDTEFDSLQKKILEYQNIDCNKDNDCYKNNYSSVANVFNKKKELNIFPNIINLNGESNNKNKNEDIGISIKNNNGPGVKVIALKKEKLAFKNGIKVNDIILFINNIPCLNHQQSIKIIDNLILSEKNQ